LGGAKTNLQIAIRREDGKEGLLMKFVLERLDLIMLV